MTLTIQNTYRVDFLAYRSHTGFGSTHPQPAPFQSSLKSCWVKEKKRKKKESFTHGSSKLQFHANKQAIFAHIHCQIPLTKSCENNVKLILFNSDFHLIVNEIIFTRL